MLEPMIFNSTHPKSNKIQTIVIQFIPNLNDKIFTISQNYF
jgi:hypothetical protein